MSLTLRHLQTFQTIIAEGSFVRAAEKLNFSQAAMTLHIQLLEQEIGMKVFTKQA